MVLLGWIVHVLYAIFPIYFLWVCKSAKRKKEDEINHLSMALKKNNLFSSLGMGFLISSTLAVFLMFFLIIYILYVSFVGNKGISLFFILGNGYEFIFILINIIVTLAVALIVYNKTIYIVFSLRDYLNEYDFGYNFVMMMLFGIGAYIVTIYKIESLQNEQCALGITIELFCFYYIVKCFVIEYIVLFGTKNTELNILNKLYRIYDIKNVRYRINDVGMQTTREAIEINLEHLFWNYALNYRRVKGECIKNIEYENYNSTNKEQWGKLAKKEYLLLSGLMCFVSVIVIIYESGRKNNIILPVLFVGIEFIYLCKSKRIKDEVINIWEGRSGFCVIDEKRHYLDFRYGIPRKKKYIKFVRSVISLAGFSEIILTEKCVNKDFVDVLETRLFQIEEKNTKVEKEFLPYFLVGYLLYKKEYRLEILKQLYKKEKESNFGKILEAFILHVDGGKATEQQGKYMNWLRGVQ